MKILLRLMSMVTVATFAPSIASGAPIFTDPLDAVGTWTVINGGDSAMVFGFDYSVHGIPEAPNSVGGAPTTGLKTTSNITPSPETDSIAAIQNLASLGHVAGSPYRVQVDVWGNYELGSGSPTEFAGVSVGRDAASSNTDGATFIYTTDGGTSRDYRMYKNFDEQRTSDVDPIEGPQYAVVSNDSLAEPFASAFPSIEPEVITGGQQGAPPGVLTGAGVGGFTWVTITAIIDPLAPGPAGTTADLGTAQFLIKNNATGTTIEVGTIDNSNGDSTLTTFEDNFGLLYADLFFSFNGSGFNFAIFDNVIVTDISGTVPEPASMLLFGLGVCGIVATRRRRHSLFSSRIKKLRMVESK